MDRESVKRGLLFGLASACLMMLLCIGFFHAHADVRLRDYLDKNFSERNVDYAIRWGDATLLNQLLSEKPLQCEACGRLVIRAMVWWRAKLPRSPEAATPESIERMQRKSCEMVNVLLKNGADVNDGGDHNETPLYAAIQFEMPDAAKLLLENGAQTDILVGPAGTPLLYYALAKGQPYFRLLIAHGADVNIRDKHGRTLMQLAKTEKLSPEQCKLLTEAGFDARVSNETSAQTTQ